MRTLLEVSHRVVLLGRRDEELDEVVDRRELVVVVLGLRVLELDCVVPVVLREVVQVDVGDDVWCCDVDDLELALDVVHGEGVCLLVLVGRVLGVVETIRRVDEELVVLR